MQNLRARGIRRAGRLRYAATVGLCRRIMWARLLRVELPLAAGLVPGWAADFHTAAGFRVIAEGHEKQLHPLFRDEVYKIGREALINAFQDRQER
jgi:hypothetical protein